jgi:DNA-binding PadR family transcriptional regulator
MCAAHVERVMRPIEFQILLTLASGERHGYAIIQDIEARPGTELSVETGTLYRALQRLVEQELVRPTDVRRSSPEDDERRRYYAITAAGRHAAAAEARRMAALVDRARAARLLPERS